MFPRLHGLLAGALELFHLHVPLLRASTQLWLTLSKIYYLPFHAIAAINLKCIFLQLDLYFQLSCLLEQRHHLSVNLR